MDMILAVEGNVATINGGKKLWNGAKQLIENRICTEKSIEVYLQSLKELCSTPIPKEEVEKTIVSTYGSAIIPACPKDRGAHSFEGMLYANPQSFRQKRVDAILALTEEDVEKASERFYEASEKKCSKAVFSNKQGKTEKSEKIAGNIIKIPI